MRRNVLILFALLALLVAMPASAQLVDYSQDFEGLVQADPGALGADGWLVFGADIAGQYGPFPAPNGGPGFSAIADNQGGPPQGAQQLVIYSDYNNPNHPNGNVEANVFQEQRVGPEDAGKTCTFAWQHKKGDIQPPTTAAAFIKVLDPNNGFPLEAFPQVDTTNLPVEWSGDEIQIVIDANWLPGATGPDGHILQFGYVTNATDYTPSGNFYDNITFTCEEGDPQGVPTMSNIALSIMLGLLAVAILFVVARTRRVTTA